MLELSSHVHTHSACQVTDSLHIFPSFPNQQADFVTWQLTCNGVLSIQGAYPNPSLHIRQCWEMVVTRYKIIQIYTNDSMTNGYKL